jgi:glutathionyl-hydroquinone reductase
MFSLGDRLTGVDVNERHFISPVCFINLEPEWIATVYWNSNNTKNVTDIPFGYQMNQFTINPAGMGPLHPSCQHGR